MSPAYAARFKNRAGAPIPQGMARAAHRLVAVGIAAACAQALAGCGSQDPATDGSGAVLQVSERDFKISAPKVVRAGDVRLVVTNRGPDDHELIVVHAPVVGSLPMRADGVTVDE